MTSAISGSSAAAQFVQSIFKKADANNDGQLTAEELDSAKAKDASAGGPSGAEIVRTADKDGDGSLSQAELEGALKAAQTKLSDAVQNLLLALQEQSGSEKSAQSKLAETLFKQADADKDGKLTEAELAAARPADAPTGAPTARDLIKAGDSNSDGKLSQSELETALTASGATANGGSSPSLAASLTRNADDSIGKLLDSLLEALDDNKDGKVDQSDINALRKKQEEADKAKAENAKVTGVGSTSYANQTANLSILLTFQEAA
jgi:Ca2+-binding EF-hand superfamily protein